MSLAVVAQMVAQPKFVGNSDGWPTSKEWWARSGSWTCAALAPLRGTVKNTWEYLGTSSVLKDLSHSVQGAQ